MEKRYMLQSLAEGKWVDMIGTEGKLSEMTNQIELANTSYWLMRMSTRLIMSFLNIGMYRIPKRRPPLRVIEARKPKFVTNPTYKTAEQLQNEIKSKKCSRKSS